MTLLELRRYAIRNRTRIHFTIPGAGDCIVDEHGLVKAPGLRAVPDFNVEASLGSIEQFVLAPAQQAFRNHKISRQDLEARLGPGTADHGHEE